MREMAPKTEGHYPNYRFPTPPEFTLEGGNQEIRNRQLEMVDTYNLLHRDVNDCLNCEGGGQFANRSDDFRERMHLACAALQVSRDEVVRDLAQIISLGGAPPPPDRGVDRDVCRLLHDAQPMLLAAYAAAGVPAPPPPPPAPQRIPRVARPRGGMMIAPRGYPRGRFRPTPLPAPPPGIDSQAHLRPQGAQAGIRPMGGLLHPQGAQADIRPLGGLIHPLVHPLLGGMAGHRLWVQEQGRLILEGQTQLARARALERHAQLQAHLRQAQQPARPVQPQPQPAPARPVQPQPQPARPVQPQPQPPLPTQTSVRPAGNKGVRDDSSSSGGRDSAQAQLQARHTEAQQPARPVQPQPQPARPTQVPVRPAGSKGVRDDSSSSGGRDSVQAQLQARHTEAQHPARPVQPQPQPALPVQVQPQAEQVPVRPAGKKRGRDDTSSSGSPAGKKRGRDDKSSSGSRGQGR